MATEADGDAATLPPDDAFAVLGNGTRMDILRALGDAAEPLTFSELRERVGVSDSGQFNYHLDKLVGHFVREVEEGYDLRGAGRRVIESVLSGAVTETPVIEPTPVSEPCHLCGGPVEVSYREERLEMYCTACEGLFGHANRTGEWLGGPEHGYLGYLPLPPSGVQGRSADEVQRAAWVWGNFQVLSLACGVCPRCAAPIERELDVCPDHDASAGLCDACDRRMALNLHHACTNCIFEGGGTFALAVIADYEYLRFVVDRGINPVNPESLAAMSRAHDNFAEEVRSTDPFEARLTFSIEGAELTLTVDGDLEVTDVSRSSAD